MNSLVSIIVPVYNVEAYLNRCLNSIKNQTYSNLEVILIDDGSTDESAAICDKYAQGDIRFKVIHKENAGVSSARNVGLEIFEGEYVSFIDSDDYIHPQFIECLCNAIEDTSAKLALYSGYKNVCPQEEIESFRDISKLSIDIPKNKQDYPQRHLIWNKLIHKSLLENIRFDLDLTYFEDLLFCSKIIVQCDYIAVCNETLYFHTEERVDSLVGNIDIEKYEKSLIVLDRLKRLYLESSPELLKTVNEAVFFRIPIGRYIKKGDFQSVNYKKALRFYRKNFFKILSARYCKFTYKLGCVLIFINPRLMK
jgi:glycosyltransferase involved in cell wall biosynthesis